MGLALAIGLGLTYGGQGGTSFVFSGSTTLAETFSGVAFTLLVSDPDYDTFVETLDADGIATLAGDEVSISGLDYETATTHSLQYSATASGAPSKPTLYLNVTITVTDVPESLGSPIGLLLVLTKAA